MAIVKASRVEYDCGVVVDLVIFDMVGCVTKKQR